MLYFNLTFFTNCAIFLKLCERMRFEAKCARTSEALQKHHFILFHFSFLKLLIAEYQT